MMRLVLLARLASLGALLLAGRPGLAAPLDPALLKGLGSDDSSEKIAAVEALTVRSGPAAIPLLSALLDDRVKVVGERVLFTDGGAVRDAATGQALPRVPEDAQDVTINNRVRRALESSLAVLRLLDPDRKVRLAAAQTLGDALRPAFLPIIDRALAQEKDGAVRERLELAQAQVRLRSDDPAVRLAAVRAQPWSPFIAGNESKQHL